MKKLICSLMLLVLFLLPAHSAYALKGPLDGRVIVGDNFTLKSGDTLDGDLVVIGGEVIIESGATVKGDIVVIGGSLQVDGQGTGNAVVIGGLVSLGEKASVSGDVVTVGGSLQRAEGAEIGGNVVTNLPPPTLVLPNPANAQVPPVPPTPSFEFGSSLEWKILLNLFILPVALGALAMLLMLFLNPQLNRVAHAMVSQPFMAGGVGLLTILIAPTGLVVLAATIILFPVALAVGFVVFTLMGLAWVFGITALGAEIGDRLTRALHQSWLPVLSAGIGTFLLSLSVGLINLLPCVGTLAMFLIGLVGIGAATMTLFGTRPVSQLALSAPVPDSKTAA
jgi:hypothetical protein